MNWEAIGAIAELLGAVGVIASLVYLATQIRANSHSVQASTSQAVADAAQARVLAVAQSSSLANALAKVLDSSTALTSAETIQVEFFRNASFKGFENVFFQYRKGLLPAATWNGYEFILRRNLHIPDTREWWNRSRDGFDPEFRDRVEELLGEPAV